MVKGCKRPSDIFRYVLVRAFCSWGVGRRTSAGWLSVGLWPGVLWLCRVWGLLSHVPFPRVYKQSASPAAGAEHLFYC